MGNLQPIVSTLNSSIGAVTTLTNTVNDLSGSTANAAEDSLRLKQSQALQALERDQEYEQAQAERTAAEEREQIAVTAQQEEDRRQKALKRAVAKQNAIRGSGGTSASGSSEAVLLGLFNESDADKQEQKQLDQLRYNAIDSDLYELDQRNVLERTQLLDQQKLERELLDY